MSSCFFCYKEKKDMDIMSCCSHRICKLCLYERIFTNHINEFQGQITLKIKCKCENGYLNQNLSQIYELLKDREKLMKIESEENNSENLKIKNEGCRCLNKNNKLLEFFCLDCQKYVCNVCKNDIISPHLKHRILNSNKLVLSLIDNIIKMNLKNKTSDEFEKYCNKFSQIFENLIENNFNQTIDKLDKLIDSAKELKNDYIRQYKAELGIYLETFRFIKLFYLNYYEDKANEIKIIEPVKSNVRVLKYLNNISYELKDIKLENLSFFDEEISTLITKFDDLKIMDDNKKLIKGEFIFEKIKKGFKMGEICLAHDKFINGLIVTKNNNKIVTASFDYYMKVWEPEKIDEAIQKEKEKIMNLYGLKNGKILASKDNNILIFELNADNKYEITQSLTKHDNNILSLCELDDGIIVSAGSDKSIIFWEEDPINKLYKIKQIINTKKEIQLILALNDFKLAYAGNDDGVINIMGTKTDLIGNKKKIVSKEYHHICKLIKLKGKINCMCKLNQDYFVSGGGDIISEKKKDHNIYIWKPYGNKYGLSQVIFNAHEGDVNSIILLRDGRFASSSKDRTIKIWEIDHRIVDNKIKFVISQSLNDYEHGLYKLIQLDDDRIVATSSDNNLVFWNNTDPIF